MTALARSLTLVAAAAIAADGLAYALLIVPGHAAERNPLILGLDPAAALGTKLAELVLVAAAACVLALAGRARVLALLLAIATVAGLLGTVTTVAAAIA